MVLKLAKSGVSLQDWSEAQPDVLSDRPYTVCREPQNTRAPSISTFFQPQRTRRSTPDTSPITEIRISWMNPEYRRGKPLDHESLCAQTLLPYHTPWVYNLVNPNSPSCSLTFPQVFLDSHRFPAGSRTFPKVPLRFCKDP